jgi:hypothetical protein
MKKFLGFGILFFLMSATLIDNRVVSTSSTTVAPTDDGYVILHTGPAATYTLGTTVANGFSCKVVNHGTGAVTFNVGITTANGQTITRLPPSNGEINPGQIGNQITIARIANVWRSI